MPRRPATSFAIITVFAFASLTHADPQQWLEKNLDDVVALYQHIHRNPELSFQEEQTAARLAQELKAVGCEVHTKIGGHGVVGFLKNGEGKTLMLRADMDALPVTEMTKLPYASQKSVTLDDGRTTGVMHACGHDIHMANLIGVARYLAANKDQWQGTLMFLLQPAEERGAGAKAMLEDGVFDRFGKPTWAVALHVDSTLATGKVGTRGGYALANVDSVDITMRGRGGHGAAPHTTIDPILQAATLVVQLQSIVAREINPIEPAVITVGSIRGGTKHNIIPDDCHLQLTVRSYTDEVRDHLLKAIERKAKAVAQGAGAPEPVVRFSDTYTPALFNSKELTAHATRVYEELLGDANVVPTPPSMGGEDFGRYGRAGVPICMYRLGSVNADRLAKLTEGGAPPPSLHSPLYYPDAKETLTTGITTLATLAVDLLKKD